MLALLLVAEFKDFTRVLREATQPICESQVSAAMLRIGKVQKNKYIGKVQKDHIYSIHFLFSIYSVNVHVTVYVDSFINLFNPNSNHEDTAKSTLTITHIYTWKRKTQYNCLL